MSTGDELKFFIINHIISLVEMNVAYWVTSCHSMNPTISGFMSFFSGLKVG